MEQSEWFDELEAQVESHGPDAVAFYLDSDVPIPLYVEDVMFADGEVRVMFNQIA